MCPARYGPTPGAETFGANPEPVAFPPYPSTALVGSFIVIHSLTCKAFESSSTFTFAFIDTVSIIYLFSRSEYKIRDFEKVIRESVAIREAVIFGQKFNIYIIYII